MAFKTKIKTMCLEHICNFILKQKELCNFWGYTKLHDPKQALPPKKKRIVKLKRKRNGCMISAYSGRSE